VVAVSSGTAALHLALAALGVTRGKEVILPALSFVSTANAVLYMGARPIFADVNPETLCLDQAKVDEAITGRTACIIPVHFGGMPCILKEKEIPIIEDAAHACGSYTGASRIGGKHGSAVCFSFNPIKNLAMPTGGAICINKERYGKSLRSMRWCGITGREGPYYDVEHLGWNCYMNEISAAIGIEQLKRLDQMNQRRYEIAEVYHANLEFHSMPLVKGCSYHLYWIRVKHRDQFIQRMNDADIEVGVHYRPIDQLSLYEKATLPATDRIAPELVSLPMHTGLTPHDLERIIKVANS